MLIAMQGHQTKTKAKIFLVNNKIGIQYLLFLTLEGKEPNFRGHKLINLSGRDSPPYVR